MYIYDQSVDQGNVYLPRPRQCLPVAYVIYHRKRPTSLPVVPIYHFHCTGITPPTASETIDLTCDNDGDDSVVAGAAVPAARSGQSVTWQGLEQQFLSLTSDMVSPHSQELNAASAVSSAVSLLPPGVTTTVTAASSYSLVYMFPVSFSSSVTSSAACSQVAATSLSSQQTRTFWSSGAVSSTDWQSVAARQSTGSVASTVASAFQGTGRLSQFTASFSFGNSANPTQTPVIKSVVSAQRFSAPPPLRVAPISSAAVIGSVVSAPRFSAPPPLRVAPSSFAPVIGSVVSGAPRFSGPPPLRVGPSSSAPYFSSVSSNTAAALAPASAVRFPPYTFHNSHPQLQTSASTYSSTTQGVLLQPSTDISKNYRVFRLQPRQPRPSDSLYTVSPQVVTTRVQSFRTIFPPVVSTSAQQLRFSIPTVCSGYTAHLASQPAPSVITVPSSSSVYFAPLSQAQFNTVPQHSVPVLPQTPSEAGHAWTACTSGSQSRSGNEYTSNSTEDEFVDVESLSIEQLTPIVIAPDDTADEYNLPADCAAPGVGVKMERTSAVQRSTSQQDEIICIDGDDLADGTDVGTHENLVDASVDGTGSELNDIDEPDAEAGLLSYNTDDIPVINIAPDDDNYSPVQSDDIPASVRFPLLSSQIADTSLTGSQLPLSSDRMNFGSFTAASTDVFSVVISSAAGSSCTEAGGSFSACSADFTGTFAQSTDVVSTPHITDWRNSLQINSTHTVHHLPQSYVNISPVPASAHTNSVVGLSSASIAPRLSLAVPSRPVLLTYLQPLYAVPTLVSPQPAPTNSAPLAAVTQSTVQTCDVTAMATQLVSGLRSDAMRRRATSAAKVAEYQSTQSETADTQSRKRHDGDNDTDVPAKSSRYIPPILDRSSRSAKKRAKSIDVPPKKPEKKKYGETVVYHLNDDGSVEIRIEKGSISENTAQQTPRKAQQGTFDAIVEIDPSASESWCSQTFVTDMEKYFDKLKVVKLPGNDSVTSSNIVVASESDHAGEHKRKSVVDVDKSLKSRSDVAELDNDSDSHLSLMIDSAAPSDDDDDQPSAVDVGENGSALTISHVCSIDAEAFTDLNEQLVMTCSSETPEHVAPAGQAAEDVEISHHGDTADVSVGNNRNDAESQGGKPIEHGHPSSSTTHSSLSAESHIEHARSNSFSSKQRFDLEDEVLSPGGDSEDASLFEVSLDDEATTDTEAVPSSTRPEETVDSSHAGSHNQQTINQQNSTTSGEIHRSIQLSADESDEQLHSGVSVVGSERSIEPTDRLTTDETSSAGIRLAVETDQLSVPEPEKSASPTRCVNSDNLSDVEPDSPLPDPSAVAADLSAVESDECSITAVGRLEMELASSAAEKSEALTICSYSSLLEIESVSPLAEPCSDNDVCDTRHQKITSHHNSVAAMELESVSEPVILPEVLDTPAGCGYGNLIETEPISPAPEVSSLPKPSVETGKGFVDLPLVLAAESVSMSCVYSSIEPVSPASELPGESDSCPLVASPPLSEAQKLKAPVIDMEPFSPISESSVETEQKSFSAEVHVASQSASSATPSDGEMTDTKPMSPVTETPGDTDELLCDITSDHSTAAVTQPPVPVDEKSDSKTGPDHNSTIDLEPLPSVDTEQPCDIDGDLSDVELAVATDHKSDHVPALENERSAFVTNTEPISPLLEHTLSTVQESISPPLPVAEKSDAPVRHDAVPQPSHYTVSDVREPKHDSSRHKLSLAPMTGRPWPNKLWNIKSALSVLEKPVRVMRPISPDWLSAELASQSCTKRARSGMIVGRRSAPAEHHVGSHHAAKQLKESHQAASRASAVTKVPKKITLADYRNRKSANSADSTCQQSELSQSELSQSVGVADPNGDGKSSSEVSESKSDSHSADMPSDSSYSTTVTPNIDIGETLSKFSESKSDSRSADMPSDFSYSTTVTDNTSVGETSLEVSESKSDSHSADMPSDSPCSGKVTANTDCVVDDSIQKQECTGKASNSTGTLDNILVTSDLQQTALPPSTVSHVADSICSSSGMAENSLFLSVDLDAQMEDETDAADNMSDSTKTAEVTDDSAHVHPSEKQILEATAARTEHSDVLPAPSCSNDEKFQAVCWDNISEWNRLSSLVDDVTTESTNDDLNTKFSVENTELLCSSGSNGELSAGDDDPEAMEADLSVAPSLTGTDAEILDDVILDFARSSEREKKVKRKRLSKKRKAARKPWMFTLIPFDTDAYSSSEPTTSSGLADVRTLPKHLRHHDRELGLKDLPVNVPLEPLDHQGHGAGVMDKSADDVMCRCSIDETSDTFRDSSLSVVSLENAKASGPGNTKQGQLSYVCSKTSLLTDSSELIDSSSVVSLEDGTPIYSTDTETNEDQLRSSKVHATDDSAKTKDSHVVKPTVTLEEALYDKFVDDISISTCVQSTQPSAITVQRESEPSNSELDIADAQQTSESPVSSLSNVELNSSHLTTINSQCGLETSDQKPNQKQTASVDDSLMDLDSTGPVDRCKHESHTAVNSEMPLESPASPDESIYHSELTAEHMPSLSEVASERDDLADVNSSKYPSPDSITAVKKDGRTEKETKPRKGHLKAATMWKDSMRNWMNMDMSKNKDIVVPLFTPSNDYFVMRDRVTRLMKSVMKLAPNVIVSLKNAISRLLKETENLLQEELVSVDIAAQLNNSEANLLVEKQIRMSNLLSSVEKQLCTMSQQLFRMTDAEAELASYEKSDWSTESSLKHNELLLTRHMLYKEMSGLRCYHNSRLMYRVPDELCLEVERDRFVSVEGSMLFLKDSILSLAQCQQLFALKVEIEEAQSSLEQLHNEGQDGKKMDDVVHRLGLLHRERKQSLDSIAVNSVKGLRILQDFLTEQLHWYR